MFRSSLAFDKTYWNPVEGNCSGYESFLRKMKITFSLGIPKSITNGVFLFCFILLAVTIIAIFVFSLMRRSCVFSSFWDFNYSLGFGGFTKAESPPSCAYLPLTPSPTGPGRSLLKPKDTSTKFLKNSLQSVMLSFYLWN